MPAQRDRPDISVIMCAHNPRHDILDLVLESLKKQTLPPSRWELIVVDNNSAPPLDTQTLNAKWSLPMRLVSEPESGLTPARRCGVRAACAELLVFVDDDNVMDPDYLEAALDIAGSEPKLGAFGGATRPIFESGSVSKWKEKLLPYLGCRDYGASAITSNEDKWGEWEPIGAGMVVRQDVARRFVEFVQTVPLALMLDRSGGGLLSGGDSLIARSAYRQGYCCSYQPRLQLRHFIKAGRTRPYYLFRLLYGHGRSFVILNNVLGKKNARITYVEVLKRLITRYCRNGLPGLICWAWDIGYLRETRADAKSNGSINSK